MEVNEVHDLEDYVILLDKIVFSEIQFNMSTVLLLKKIKHYEIDYIEEYGKTGTAFKIFETLLTYYPSKTWNVLGSELISILEFWITSLRERLLDQGKRCWAFFKMFLKCIHEIKQKDATLTNVLVELITQPLLELIIDNHLDVHQKYEVLHCLNLYCSESSRDIRFALRKKFESYLIKLSRLMATCGYLPCQFAIIETLMRWLLPRHDESTRLNAAAKWFPEPLYNSLSIQVFQKNRWQNFYQDAREFLCAVNLDSPSITSVICKGFIVGEKVIISGNETLIQWLDINSATKCFSVILVPKQLQLFGVPKHSACEVLKIASENTQLSEIRREESLIIMKMKTVLQLYPSSYVMDTSVEDVIITISLRNNYTTVDCALRKTLGDKYKTADIRLNSPDPVTRRRKRTGYILRSKNSEVNSQSTASTSSLAQLRDRLQVLPHCTYNKELVSVCAEPALSRITEESESERSQNIKAKSYGVCYRGIIRESKSIEAEKGLSPVVYDENSTSCLLVATIGSVDPSVISDTMENFSKTKTSSSDNIVDSLIKEALRNKNHDMSNINKNKIKPDDFNDTNLEIIENTPAVDTILKSAINNNSQREIQNGSGDGPKYPVSPNDFVCVRENIVSNNKKRDILTESNTVVTVEKIDEIEPNPETTTSICNENLEEFAKTYPVSEINLFEINDLDVIGCLNDIVDKVCINFDKYLNKQNTKGISLSTSIMKKNPKKQTKRNVASREYRTQKNLKPLTKKKAETEKIKLKYNINEKKQSRMAKKNLKSKQTVIEDIAISDHTSLGAEILNEESKAIEADSVKTRKKRKLYSPKDEHNNIIKSGRHISETEDDCTLSDFKTTKNDTPKPKENTYKEIAKERKKNNRKPRPFRNKPQSSIYPKKNRLDEIFDKLKEDISNDCQVSLVERKSSNDFGVYNFTSDSEDIFYKNEIKKRPSAASVASATSQRGRSISRVNYCESSPGIYGKIDNNKTKQNIRKRRGLRHNDIEEYNVIDEKMRDVFLDVLNTSLTIEKPENVLHKTLRPCINVTPTMKEISEPVNCEPDVQVVNKKSSRKINKKEKKMTTKKGKKKQNMPLITENDRTESPLPGLVIEKSTFATSDVNDSLKSSIIEKFKEICDGRVLHSDLPCLSSDITRIEDNTTKTENIIEFLTESFTEKSEKQKTKNISNLINVSNKSSKSDMNNSNSTNVLNTKQQNCKDKPKKIVSSEIEIIDKSYSTVGTSPIRVHRDSDDIPPDQISLDKSIQHRNLVAEYLNESQLDFYDVLRKAVSEFPTNESNYLDIRSFSEFKNDESSQKNTNVKLNSPKNEYDISKYLPSPKSSNSSSESDITNIQIQKVVSNLTSEIKTVESSKMFRETREKTTAKVKPTDGFEEVVICNSTAKPTDYYKGVAMTNSIIKPTAFYTEHTTNSNVESKDYCSEITILNNNLIPSKNASESNCNLRETDNFKEVDKSDNYNKPTDNYRETTKYNRNEKSAGNYKEGSISKSNIKSADCKNKVIRNKIRELDTKVESCAKSIEVLKKSTQEQTNSRLRKSLISPVKLFSDIIATSQESDLVPSVSVINLGSDDSEIHGKLNKPRLNKPKNFNISPKSLDTSSGMNSSGTVKKCKRTPDVEEINVKRRKVSKVEDINKWIDSQKSTRVTVDRVQSEAKECTQNVLERIDTTLLDINRNTNDLVVEFYLGCERELQERNRQRRQVQEEMIRDILKEVNQLLNDKFREIEERSRETEEQLKKKIKENAAKLIKKDAKQRRDLVAILRDDLQITMENMSNDE